MLGEGGVEMEVSSGASGSLAFVCDMEYIVSATGSTLRESCCGMAGSFCDECEETECTEEMSSVGEEELGDGVEKVDGGPRCCI